MARFDRSIVSRRVRSNAVWAGIGAALLLYFGYSTVFLSSDAWTVRAGALVIQYTLKAGGWALALATAWLATGMRPALRFDAVVSVLIGVGFLSGGALLLVAGPDLQSMLYVVFAVMFLGAGRNSWREHALLSRTEAVTSGVELLSGLVVPPPDNDSPRPGASRPTRLQKQARASEAAPARPRLPQSPGHPVAEESRDRGPDPDLAADPPPNAPTAKDADASPLPDGFLAQFAPPETPAEDEESSG